MKHKIVLITGANSGIGKAAALKFATEQSRVVMACRNMKISQAAQKEIAEASNNSNVDLMELDVSSFASIRAFCSAFQAKYPRLDILIHNAAYLSHGEKQYKVSPEHIELSFATNAFGPFLMTRLLAEHLGKSQDPRVLNACTTNIKHFFDPNRNIEFDNLRGEFRDTRPYSVYKMYGDSKMALLMLTFKMARHYKSEGIKVNTLQINRVKLSKETIQKMRSFWKVLARVQNLTNPLPSSMADTYYHICTSDDFHNVTGQLINHKREIVQPASPDDNGVTRLKNILGSGKYPSYAADARNVERIWGLSTALTEG